MRRESILPALTFGLLLSSGAASAQDFDPGPGFSLAVGGMAVVTPVYEGSEDYEVIGFPLIYPTGLGGDGRFSIKGVDDIRFRILGAAGLEVGAVAGYRFGRNEDDAEILNGLGDIDGGLVVGAYAGYRLGAVLLDVSYGHEVTGAETGGLLRFGAELETKASPQLTLTTRIGTTYASEDYVDAYFGITPQQSARSGLAAFDPEAGFKDVHASLAASYDLTPQWTILAFGRYAHLIGDAADSPTTQTESQFTAGLGLTYDLSFGK